MAHHPLPRLAQDHAPVVTATVVNAYIITNVEAGHCATPKSNPISIGLDSRATISGR